MRLALLLVCVGGLALGCAHSHDKFYYRDGQLCAEITSTVLGTGETEKSVTDTECGIVFYDTKDTGLSDNVGKVVEGLAKGAVKGIVPVP